MIQLAQCLSNWRVPYGSQVQFPYETNICMAYRYLFLVWLFLCVILCLKAS